jgi:hypothetical protein
LVILEPAIRPTSAQTESEIKFLVKWRGVRCSGPRVLQYDRDGGIVEDGGGKISAAPERLIKAQVDDACSSLVNIGPSVVSGAGKCNLRKSEEREKWKKINGQF